MQPSEFMGLTPPQFRRLSDYYEEYQREMKRAAEAAKRH